MKKFFRTCLALILIGISYPLFLKGWVICRVLRAYHQVLYRTGARDGYTRRIELELEEIQNEVDYVQNYYD